LVPKKGFDILVRAAAIARGQRRDLVVEIVGEGRERAALDSLIAELGLEASVRMVGALSHDETLDRIAAARVFCLAARVAADGDRDSMPVVIKEALAREVPVVATRAVAVPEMVDDEVGRLATPEDAEELADALLQVLALSDSDRDAVGRAGRARVLERFTLEGETAKLLALFDEEAGA
jgi:glycosyltransferase involved in cell wall biosynthesis